MFTLFACENKSTLNILLYILELANKSREEEEIGVIENILKHAREKNLQRSFENNGFDAAHKMFRPVVSRES